MTILSGDALIRYFQDHGYDCRASAGQAASFQLDTSIFSAVQRCIPYGLCASDPPPFVRDLLARKRLFYWSYTEALLFTADEPDLYDPDGCVVYCISDPKEWHEL